MLNPQNSPKEWENYFKDIIRLHYQPSNYRDVPDKHVGDFGIECYTLSGHVFQCYLPSQISDIKKLVDAQRQKINDDIKKFTLTNVSELKKLFGGIEISRWILATSANESAVLAQFCAQKSIDVRAMGISYISSDFEILIHTDKEYPVEVGYLLRENYQLSFNFTNASSETVVRWISENSEFLSKLDMKVPKIEREVERLVVLRNFIIQKYLDYQNLMDLLRQDWPEIYSKIFNCIQNRENSLIGRFLLGASAMLPSDVIKEEMMKLNNNILDEVKSFKGADLEKIQWGVISDWLIRCPLDF